MKVALVNNYYYLRGGCERVLFGDMRALADKGVEVWPFAARHERNEPAISSRYFPEVADYREQGLASKARAAISVVYSAMVGRAFSRFLDDFSPDIIHCHNIYARITTAVLDVAKGRGIPVVLTAHDQKLVCPAYLGLRRGRPCQLCSDGGYWRCLRWKCHKDSRAASLIYTMEAYFTRLRHKYEPVSRFLCASRFLQSSLVKAGISEERTVYHPNALPGSEFAPQFEPGSYMLYVGRLSEEKGLSTLLDAIERTPIPLRVAGTGPFENELRARIAERKLPVHMDGFCSGESLSELYRNAAFTVVPSECYENASMSILESLAYGKAVLASEIGGNPELVVDGETGRLFPPGDSLALAESAAQMWASRDELSRMGKRARTKIVSHFGMERRVVDLLAIYNQALQNRSVAGSIP
jgi:glycosyltransferase involved in cell wall biosynthesis